MSNVVLGMYLGGELSPYGCAGHTREQNCVLADSATWYNYGYFIQMNWDGYWQLLEGETKILASGQLSTVTDEWFSLEIGVKNGIIHAKWNNEVLESGLDVGDDNFTVGWVGIGCGWQPCQFRQFAIS